MSESKAIVYLKMPKPKKGQEHGCQLRDVSPAMGTSTAAKIKSAYPWSVVPKPEPK